jgi:ATP-dependent exoDNAse (exonuclease V) alpha subunit
VAIYLLSATVLKRSAGRSATASAAYRAAERVDDERTGQSFDYTRKRGVLHTEIMAPEGTPTWMQDRAQLWNAVEKAEKRKDSQLAREVLLSLPHELTADQRRELVQEFVRSKFVTQGMIADIAIHAPHRRGDDRNFHAHVLLTMRELAGDGFGKKAREWNDTEQLEAWREHWAQTVNRHLEQHGHDARIDHRSLEAQGIDREPEPKQGPIATEMERQGRASHAGDDRRAAQARNEERAAIAAELATVTAEIIDLDAERARRRPVDRDETTGALPSQADEIVDAEERYKKIKGQHYDSADPYASLAAAAQAEYDAFALSRRNLEEQIAKTKDAREREALELRKEIEAAEYMAITDRRIAEQSQFITGQEDSAEAVRVKTQADDYEARAKELRRQLHDRRSSKDEEGRRSEAENRNEQSLAELREERKRQQEQSEIGNPVHDRGRTR